MSLSQSISSLSDLIRIFTDNENISSPLPRPPQISQVLAAAEDQNGTSFTSSMSAASDPSELSSVLSSLSSKATTPVEGGDSSKEVSAPQLSTPRPSRSREVPRKRYDVRPKVSIPPGLALREYAMQCIAAAESSRLNPSALHQDEYLMLRDHISHAQVTTYLNIRNGILRLWIRNPQIAVTREEAIGCAKDARWFDVASVSFDWLVRHGYINFGCVEVKPSLKKRIDEAAKPHAKQKTVVVIGAGMSGLGCARQLQGLFAQYSRRFRDLDELPPKVIVLEGRNRVGGRVYSRAFRTTPKYPDPRFEGKRFTSEMGGMIVTGFERGNPLNVLVRGQLGLPYYELRTTTTLYDSNGKPVDLDRDSPLEKLYNYCLERVSEYKFKPATSKLIEGNRDLMEEGRDSSAEVHKTIRQAEEALAAGPHAPPISEQSMAPQINVIPVSSDRATGRILTKPGNPSSENAAHMAVKFGLTLKNGISEDEDFELDRAAQVPGATLGTVTDNVIEQYKKFIDLNPLDYRLINWHIANLEYANATNYHQMSLKGWDIDVGNEWEGKHTMIIGGYQAVPRGLVHCPTPLDLRQQCSVHKIAYNPRDASAGGAKVYCDDGSIVDADYVVSTIPLGVLKHGNVKFEPPLPTWKSDAIHRLGFGVLNKVMLVFSEPFWDQDRDIFGVLRTPSNRHSVDQREYAAPRGRFFQWFNISKTTGLPCLLALMAGDAAFSTEQTSNDDLIAEAVGVLRSIHGQSVPYPVECVVTRWASDKFARGSYSFAGIDMEQDDYDVMARSVGNLFFAGEHTTGTHPATVHGAYLSGLRAASEVVDAMLGPIDIPTPLIIPKETHVSLKRTTSGSKDTTPITTPIRREPASVTRIREEAPQPSPEAPPQSPLAIAAYKLFHEVYESQAREICAAERKRKPTTDEVRDMTAKMWEEASPGERAPFESTAKDDAEFGTGALQVSATSSENPTENPTTNPTTNPTMNPLANPRGRRSARNIPESRPAAPRGRNKRARINPANERGSGEATGSDPMDLGP